MMLRRAIPIAIPLVIAGLELSHPTWPGDSVALGVAAAGGWWIPLHVLLIVGYAALVWSQWRCSSPLGRILLAAFVACSTLFLALDGVVVGVLAQMNPAAADDLWASLPATVLANASGATWCAALVVVALSDNRRSHFVTSSAVRGLAVLTWLVFVAGSAFPPAKLAATPMAVVTGFICIFLAGSSALPSAFLILAGVTRQHVGSEAAVGMVWIALARFYRTMRP